MESPRGGSPLQEKPSLPLEKTPSRTRMQRAMTRKVIETARRVKRATISDLQRDSEGFLTLGTLLAAKRGEIKRVVRIEGTASVTTSMEHWLFDSEASVGRQISFREFELDLNDRKVKDAGASNGECSQQESKQREHSAPDDAAEAAAASWTRSSLPIHEGGGIGGEWFHSHSADPRILSLLRTTFGVQEEHIIEAATPSLDGPKVSFSAGATIEDDYLFIVAHELRLGNLITAPVTAPSHHRMSFFRHMTASQTHVAPAPPPEQEDEEASSVNRRGSMEVIRDAGSDLQLEEVQLAFFYFPERKLLFSIGNSNESELVVAARKALSSHRSVVRRDCLSSPSGGCTSLLVVLLDSLMDQVFPILDIYGDALEGLGLLLAREPSHKHVRLSHRLKTRVTQIRRYTWDAKGLFMELRQDMCGCIDKKKLLQTLIDSTDQMEKEAEAYLQTCSSIENFYASFQDSRMNTTLFTLTTATICLLPLQCLTGLWGMNFVNMPELEWKYGYVMFWTLAAIFLSCAIAYTVRANRVSSAGSVILLDEDGGPTTTRPRRKQ